MTLLLMHTSAVDQKHLLHAAWPADPQGIGSIISHARRYQLFACLGLATDDDDDGQAGMSSSPAAAGSGTSTADTAGKREAARAEAPQEPQAPSADVRDENEIATAEQVKAIQNICSGQNWGRQPDGNGLAA